MDHLPIHDLVFNTKQSRGPFLIRIEVPRLPPVVSMLLHDRWRVGGAALCAYPREARALGFLLLAREVSVSLSG